MNKNIWLDGMMGLIVGDALGVPVEFCHRNEIKNRIQGPVSTMVLADDLSYSKTTNPRHSPICFSCL